MIISTLDPSLHASFVFDAVRKRAYDWPYLPTDTDWLVDTARRTLVSNPRGCLLASDGKDLFYGYVLTEPPNIITFAYTKDALRGPGAFDAPVGTAHVHEPVASTLIAKALPGVDRFAVRIWSRVASRIAERGYNIYPMAPT